MIVACHQLHYLPWIRYFDKIARADVFVVLDDIQFNKNGWHNRNSIKGPQGALCLTVPVLHHYQQRLDEVEIDNKTDWRRKHWKSLLMNYGRSGYFAVHKRFFEGIYRRKWQKLNALNGEILFYLIKSLGIKTRVVKSSELKVEGIATERLINLCKALRADTYLSGAYAATAYLDVEMFKRSGIKVALQDWQCPSYLQQYNRLGFIPDLSIVDLLFNHGQESMDIIKKADKEKRG